MQGSYKFGSMPTSAQKCPRPRDSGNIGTGQVARPRTSRLFPDSPNRVIFHSIHYLAACFLRGPACGADTWLAQLC